MKRPNNKLSPRNPQGTLRLRVRRDVSGGLDIDVATHDMVAVVPARKLRKRKASQTAEPRRRSRAAAGKPQLILFLAANPNGSSQLALGEECAAIQRELKMTLGRDEFRFESRWAVSIDELLRHLTELDPTVIHFSGHGGGSAGLIFQDEQGRPQPVSARALTMVIGVAARNVRVVVLNACYSSVQAEALRGTVDCVVGMNGAISEDAARAFAVRLYGAIGNHRSIGDAVLQGIAVLAARRMPDEVMPRCLTRNGVDPHDLVLARIPTRAPRARRRRAARAGPKPAPDSAPAVP